MLTSCMYKYTYLEKIAGIIPLHSENIFTSQNAEF